MTSEPVTYIGVTLGPNAGDNDALWFVRVVPDGKEGNKVFGRTLNQGEVDSGIGIMRQPGEEMCFRPGSVKVTIWDIDRENLPAEDGYADISNTVWTWLQIGPRPTETFFNYLFAASRRLDQAHALTVDALSGLGDRPGEPFIKTRSRLFNALGKAELMCIALSRAISMMKDIPTKFSTTTSLPIEVDSVLAALKSIRNAFEHIEDRVFGVVNASGRRDTDAITVFNQSDFLRSGVLSYGSHSLDLEKQVIPTLVAARKFLFDMAVEKHGKAKTLNTSVEFFR